MLMLARGLGRVNYFSEPEARALLDLKGQWGYQDPRSQMQNCELCANDVFRESWKETGVRPTAFQPPKPGGAAADASSGNGQPAAPATASSAAHGTPDQEALIQAITDRVLAALAQRS
jgi:L-fuculose-phosphate aldolase